MTDEVTSSTQAAPDAPQPGVTTDTKLTGAQAQARSAALSGPNPGVTTRYAGGAGFFDQRDLVAKDKRAGK